MKTCSRCKTAKPPTEFYRDPRVNDGLQSHCRDCHREVRRGAPPPRCPCGKRKVRYHSHCRECREAQKEPAQRRDRCQARGCDLPVRDGSRMCGIHLPTFMRETPPIEDYATKGWCSWD